MRGAGRPYYLADQVMDLALAIQEAGKVTNAWYIGEEIKTVLETALPGYREFDTEAARHTIARGVLQLLASNLVSQPAQAASGERDMEAGIEEMTSAWERMREETRRQFPTAATKKKRSAIARAMVAKPSPEPEHPPKEHKPSTAEAMRKRRRELAGEGRG